VRKYPADKVMSLPSTSLQRHHSSLERKKEGFSSWKEPKKKDSKKRRDGRMGELNVGGSNRCKGKGKLTTRRGEGTDFQLGKGGKKKKSGAGSVAGEKGGVQTR